MIPRAKTIPARSAIATAALLATASVLPSAATATSSPSFKVLYTFAGGNTDGFRPTAPPTLIHGLLYGVTTQGGFTSQGGSGRKCQGGDGCGTFYSLKPNAGVDTILYNYPAVLPYGAYPSQGILPFNGAFITYGYGEGASGGGMIYQFSSSYVPAPIYAFKGHTAHSISVSIYGGAFYGTDAPYGTEPSAGTLFELNPTTGGFLWQYNFASLAAGGGYLSTPILSSGKIYITSSNGGDSGNGNIIAYDIKSKSASTLYSFTNGTDGAYPKGLVVVGGILYGYSRANVGNTASPNGTLYSFNPSTNTFTVLHDFQATEGADLNSLVALNGVLYGTAYDGGATGGGSVYSWNIASSTFTLIHSFSGSADGNIPAGLTVGGKVIYGAAEAGGVLKNNTGGEGTIFAIAP